MSGGVWGTLIQFVLVQFENCKTTVFLQFTDILKQRLLHEVAI